MADDSDDVNAPSNPFDPSAGSQTPSVASAAQPARPVSPALSAAGIRPRVYLSLEQIGRKFGVGERTAHKIVAQEWWPDPVELRPRVRRWIEEEIDLAVAAHAPRAERQPEPASLLRGKVEKLKRDGVAA